MDIDKLVLTKGEIKEAVKWYSKNIINKMLVYSDGILCGDARDEAISLATVKKVFKWGDEPCTEHWKRIIPHKDCVQCQQEIKKALEEG